MSVHHGAIARICMLSAALVMQFSCAGTSLAQAYPAKSVKGIVGFPAGGGSDALARLVCAALSEKFGQQFVVDN